MQNSRSRIDPSDSALLFRPGHELGEACFRSVNVYKFV